MGPDSACVFCSLIESGAAEWIVRDGEAVAFLPLPDSALAAGHTLVVPRRHAVGVQDVSQSDLALTMELVQRVAVAMEGALGACGVNVLNASGPNSGQSVPHLHFHVVPRYEDDDETTLPWPRSRSKHSIEGDVRGLLARALIAE